MAINATNSGTKRELIPADNYIARCYQMIEIGTVKESFQGETKTMTKVRIGWELPELKKVFNEEKGEQPYVISKEYTLSMNEKANLRKMLESWRGVGFSDADAAKFDITKLIGAPCMLNITHKPSKDGSKTYEEISSVSRLHKSVTCPPQINESFVLSYDDWSWDKFNSLPQFIREKMQTSQQYNELQSFEKGAVDLPHNNNDTSDDLPF